VTASVRLIVATSNPGKLREYRTLAGPAAGIELDLLPGFASLPSFEESAPTFAENAAGKALHYSRFTDELLLAEDSGLVVPALGGAPGPRSARYGGPDATDADRVRKLIEELGPRPASERRARFVAVAALARQGEPVAVFSDFVEGVLTDQPRGEDGFGYDPIFLFEPLGCTFAELGVEQKNQHSHRARAFRKVVSFLRSREAALLL
jgi:XTP/dITP diphosphohydrolase